MNKNIDEKAKLYPVTKGNQLIQNSRYNLTLQQQKLVAYAISKIKPGQESFEWLDISVQDFNLLCGKTGNPGSNDYLLFRDAVMGLSETFFLEELETDEFGNAKVDKNGNYIKRTTNVNWFDFELEERINSAGDTVASKGRIKLNDKLNKHLIGLKGVYTSYSLQFILPMKSKFSIRLYEYLNSYTNLGEVMEIDLEELKDVLLSENDGTRDPNKYKKYSDFYRRVLADAIAEINRYTDINVTIEQTKTFKRNVYAVVFRVQKQIQVLDRDNNPVDMSGHDAEQAFGRQCFAYKDGASKPLFKRELLKRVDLKYENKAQQKIWELIVNQYATLANRHSKTDRRIDGGNVMYIDLFNEMIEQDSLQKMMAAQLEKYSSRQFEQLLEEKTVYNSDAYIKGCITKDVENWREFLRKSEKMYFETAIPDDETFFDITPPPPPED